MDSKRAWSSHLTLFRAETSHSPSMEFMEDTERRLRSLGYID